jgi:hypothetical protein
VNTLAYLDTGANLITISPKLAESLPRTGTVTIGSAFEQRVFEAVEAIEIGFLGYNRRVGARVKPISDSALPFNSDVTLDASTIFAQTLDLIKIYFDFRNDFCVSIEFGSYAARNMFP